MNERILNHYTYFAFNDAFWALPANKRADFYLDWARDLQGVAACAHFYQVAPMRADTDGMVWCALPSEHTKDSAVFFEAMGRSLNDRRVYIRPVQTLWGYTKPSTYARGSSSQEIDPLSAQRAPYLILYPFVKTIEWYLLGKDTRQGMMNEHIRVGHQYPEIKQLLLYSFGLQDQEFVVVYETDDLVHFSDLVNELRSTEVRRYTERDTPIYPGVWHTPQQMAALHTPLSGGKMKTAVLLMAYGGPDNLDELEPYLLDVRSGRPVSPELLSEMRQRYASIGGRSPLLDITRQQAAALEAYLNREAAGGTGSFKVYVGMRHWRPYIREAVAQISKDGFQKVIAICMAPHASRLSTGAYRKKLEEAQVSLGQPLEVEFVESWYDRPLFIQALAETVRGAAAGVPAEALPGLRYVFSAHSLPATILEQGDAYADQLNETARLLAASLKLDPAQWLFCFQSAGAMDGRWLGPQIHEVLPELAASGVKDVLATPIGFVAEHVEVLYDLDIEARQQAQSLGIQLYRSESLNTNPAFIAAVADLVLNHEKVIYSR